MDQYFTPLFRGEESLTGVYAHCATCRVCAETGY